MKTFYVLAYQEDDPQERLIAVTLHDIGNHDYYGKRHEVAYSVKINEDLVTVGTGFYPGAAMIPESYKSACDLLDFLNYTISDAILVYQDNLGNWFDQTGNRWYTWQIGEDDDKFTCDLCNQEIDHGWTCFDADVDLCTDHVVKLVKTDNGFTCL